MRILLFTTLLFFVVAFSYGQVKTKLFLKGLPETYQKQSEQNSSVQKIAAPDEIKSLKDSTPLSSEYSNQFAVAKKVNIDVVSDENIREEGDFYIYTLLLVAEEARNVSIAFDSFCLSENAILSIYTRYELTDSITADQNNENNRWASRVYQGDSLTFSLKYPKGEKEHTVLHIGTVNFGYKPFGQEFYGNPGASAACNLNVVCPEANGWQNERNSVALIVSGGIAQCTGTLIMNACNRSTPYLLSANHCLNSSVNSWVFQFQYWSPTCNPNGVGNESVQFNGCVNRANSAPTDFLLLQLNTVPAANLGLFYSGWDRNATPPNGSVNIHHPAGDLMKFSQDLNTSTTTSWGGTNNHWFDIFEIGTVQPGSSGSPLYDMNHRIVGQLHGDQQNMGNYCLQRRGEYGRFDLSWTGGGTSTTRLSSWLGTTGTVPMTTNTTARANLFPTSISISGPSAICSASAQSYSIANVPPGAIINWVASGAISISGPANVNPVSVIRTTTGNWPGTLSVTVQAPCSNLTASKPIAVGVAMPPFTVSNSCASADAYIDFTILPGTTLNAVYEGGTTTPLYQISDSRYILPANVFGVTVDLTNSCGTATVSKLIARASCKMGLSISPNPASNNLTISTSQQNKSTQQFSTIKEIQIVDKLGNIKKKENYTSNSGKVSVNIANLSPDVYTIKVFNGTVWESIKFIKK